MTEPIPYINGKTGETIGTVYTEGITRMSRKKLRHFLSHDEDLNIEVIDHLYSDCDHKAAVLS